MDDVHMAFGMMFEDQKTSIYKLLVQSLNRGKDSQDADDNQQCWIVDDSQGVDNPVPK